MVEIPRQKYVKYQTKLHHSPHQQVKMSADALPITSARFSKALEDLPISSLHAKVNELRNSISHLQKSNKELEEYVRQEDDKECYEALVENREVIRRMEERIELVKKEIIENRGLPFEPEQKPREEAVRENGNVEADTEMRDLASDERNHAAAGTQSHQNGLARTEQEEDGVFL